MDEIDGVGSFTFAHCLQEAMAFVGLIFCIVGLVFTLLVWNVYAAYPTYKELFVLVAQASLVGSVLYVGAAYIWVPHDLKGALGAALVAGILSVWLDKMDAFMGMQTIFVTIALLMFVTLIASLLFWNRPT